MRIGIIGASGNIGQRVHAEARARGHDVIPYTRIGAAARGLAWRDLDVFDLDAVRAAVCMPLDVLVGAHQPGNAAADLADTLARSIADPGFYARAATVLVRALAARPATRLIVIGGAGSLELEPGVVGADAPSLPETLQAIGLPADYAVAVRGHRDALHVLRLSNRRWTYASPPADIRAGERTGRFRVGGDQLLRDAGGHSRISFEDFAVAIVDEIELPQHVQRRFTVAY